MNFVKLKRWWEKTAKNSLRALILRYNIDNFQKNWSFQYALKQHILLDIIHFDCEAMNATKTDKKKLLFGGDRSRDVALDSETGQQRRAGSRRSWRTETSLIYSSRPSMASLWRRLPQTHSIYSPLLHHLNVRQKHFFLHRGHQSFYVSLTLIDHSAFGNSCLYLRLWQNKT